MNIESAILAHQSHTPEVRIDVELSPENQGVLRGVALAMLNRAEMERAAAHTRNRNMFTDAADLRDIISEFGWHKD